MIEVWIQLILGLWILASPWLLAFSDISIAKWSNVFVGIILVLMSVWKILSKVPVGPPKK